MAPLERQDLTGGRGWVSRSCCPTLASTSVIAHGATSAHITLPGQALTV